MASHPTAIYVYMCSRVRVCGCSCLRDLMRACARVYVCVRTNEESTYMRPLPFMWTSRYVGNCGGSFFLSFRMGFTYRGFHLASPSSGCPQCCLARLAVGRSPAQLVIPFRRRLGTTSAPTARLSLGRSGRAPLETSGAAGNAFDDSPSSGRPHGLLATWPSGPRLLPIVAIPASSCSLAPRRDSPRGSGRD